MKKYLIGILLLSGCSESMSPDHCKMLGVDVAENDTKTGIILEEYKVNLATVKIKCRRPFNYIEGCAVPVNPGEYIIWYIDKPKVLEHERCHALYEERKHT